jgi:hypothetical protein
VVFLSQPSGFWRGRGLNFSGLDFAMDQLTDLGLNPGFELMGNPGNAMDRSDRLFTNFSDAAQIEGWRTLVATIAARYVARYGLDVVRKWRFESWNEPDGECKNMLAANIACTPDSFLAYFDGSLAGLRSVDEQLLFGGPASDGADQFLFNLIAHCTNKTAAAAATTYTNTSTSTSTSISSGTASSAACGRIDFLNVHKKGDQSTAAITTQELPVALLTKGLVRGTSLESAAWGNDEADPKVHWSSYYTWQADSR